MFQAQLGCWSALSPVLGIKNQVVGIDGKNKKLSNPYSTGGVHFEAHVQALFVALMLTGGHAPCLLGNQTSGQD